MHKHTLLGKRKAFRFTRWSRNAAASFHSIKMVVNIGQLRANVLERIALKCANAIRALLVGRRMVVETIESEDALDAVPPDLLEELMIAPTASEVVATASPIQTP